MRPSPSSLSRPLQALSVRVGKPNICAPSGMPSPGHGENGARHCLSVCLSLISVRWQPQREQGSTATTELPTCKALCMRYKRGTVRRHSVGGRVSVCPSACLSLCWPSLRDACRGLQDFIEFCPARGTSRARRNDSGKNFVVSSGPFQHDP